MKKIVLIIVLAAFCGTYVIADDAASPYALAAVHAEQDKDEFKDPGWGWMAYGATTLLSPVMGGLTIGAAYTMDPDASIPTRRLLAADQFFEDDKDILTYKYAYEDAASEYLKQDRVKRTWIGAGAGLATGVVLVGAYCGVMFFLLQEQQSSY